MRRRQLHGWVQHLAVTSELARDTGADIYNLPRFVEQIETIDSARERVCRLSDGDEHILMLSVQQIPMPRSGRSQFFAHGLMDRQPQRAELAMNMLEMGMTLRPRAARLELGHSHPIARELAGLLVAHQPLQYQSMPRFEAILHGPDHLNLPLISRLATQQATATHLHHR